MLVVDGVQYFGKSLGTYVGLGTNTPLYIGGMNDYSTLSVESGFVTGFAGEAPLIQDGLFQHSCVCLHVFYCLVIQAASVEWLLTVSTSTLRRKR